MTKDELQTRIKNVTLKYDLDRRKVLEDYCNENNPYKVGDTFTDHIGTIKIDKIGHYFTSDYDRSCCIYFGNELKKDGTPKKNDKIRSAYQSNDIKLD